MSSVGAGRPVVADRRALPPLRARRRAHRRGHDQHRRREPVAVGSPPARRHALPWYQHHAIEPGWDGELVRHEDDRLGSHHPGAPVPDRQAQHPGPGRRVRRVHRPGRAGAAWSVGAGPTSCSPCRRRSPSGRPAGPVARARRVPFVFNIQDVFPDVAVELGAAHRPAGHRRGVVARADHLPRAPTRSRCCPTTCATTSRAKLAAGHRPGDPAKVRVIPNFVDTERIRPGPNGERLPARVRPHRQDAS